MIEQVITYQTDMHHKSEFTKLDFTLVGAWCIERVDCNCSSTVNKIKSDG